MTWLVVQSVRADAKEMNAGSNHLTNPRGYQSGRLKRVPGQTLCGRKPFDFQAVRGLPTCPRCIAHATAHRIVPVGILAECKGPPCDHESHPGLGTLYGEPESDLEPHPDDCFLCLAGHPLKAGRIHYGTQHRGMIPDAPCTFQEAKE